MSSCLSCVLWGVCNSLCLCFTCPLPLLFSFWRLGELSVSICAVSPLGVLCLCDCLWGSCAYLWPVCGGYLLSLKY